MRTGFIGAGVVGTALGKLLQGRGFEIVGYSSRTEKSAREAAGITGSEYFPDPADLTPKCDLLFITTPDDAIEKAAQMLGNGKAYKCGQVVAHVSGSLSSRVLAPASAAGAYVLSLHPLQSCATVEQAVKNLPRSVFSLEGDEKAVEVGKKIVRAIGGKYFILETENKILYHAAACMVSNYLVTLFDLSADMMRRTGVGEELLASALLPLVEGTVDNLRRLKPYRALTGPIARGDVATVKGHLETIEAKMPHLLEVYRLLGEHTLRLSVKKGHLKEENKRELAILLGANL